MRFGFVTAVQLGLSCLEEIYGVGGRVEFLMTLRDDISPGKSGRVQLDDFSVSHGVPLHKVRNINDPDSVALIRAAALDWLFIIGWSQIAGSEVLEATTHGCIGMHPTLLPEGRGRASIPWAIIKGLDETGVTMFQLDAGVDTGPIIGQLAVPIATTETATTLYSKVIGAHCSLMNTTYRKLLVGEVRLRDQDESRASIWAGRTPADGQLKPTMTVEEIDRLVRATTRPYPGAFIAQPGGELLTVWAGRVDPPRSEPRMPISANDGIYWATDTEFRSRVVTPHPG